MLIALSTRKKLTLRNETDIFSSGVLGLVVAYNPDYVQEAWHLVLMCAFRPRRLMRPNGTNFDLRICRPCDAARLLLLQCKPIELAL